LSEVRATVRDGEDRRLDLGEVPDTLFEQVCAARGGRLEETQRPLRLDESREHHDPDAGALLG